MFQNGINRASLSFKRYPLPRVLLLLLTTTLLILQFDMLPHLLLAFLLASTVSAQDDCADLTNCVEQVTGLRDMLNDYHDNYLNTDYVPTYVVDANFPIPTWPLPLVPTYSGSCQQQVDTCDLYWTYLLPTFSALSYVLNVPNAFPIPVVDGTINKQETIVTCETGFQRLVCPAGYHIATGSAFFGRNLTSECVDKSVGDYYSGVTCGVSADEIALITGLFENWCDNKEECYVYSSNGILLNGDPCEGTPKYLEVSFECLPN